MKTEVLDLAKDLIACESITPDDGGCQELIAHKLRRHGFTIEHFPSGEVSNLWARRNQESPCLAFAGHTDVVPVGDLTKWDTPPFTPTVNGDMLFGRGACDMKTGIASMVVAMERFIEKNPNHRGSLGMLITSDEEGVAIDGTKYVMEQLTARGEKIDWCLVGEPSSSDVLGDVIRVGRRGTLSGDATIHGSLGHVAFPELTPNVLHGTIPVLQKLVDQVWDNGNQNFKPTSFQISNLNVGTGADNVIPGELSVQFNFRYNTEQKAESLQNFVIESLNSLKPTFTYELDWRHGGKPFLSQQGKLTEIVCQVIYELTQQQPNKSTGGGTSDARFIVPTGTETVELGHINRTAHKYNESVRIEDLEHLATIYETILHRMLVA